MKGLIIFNLKRRFFSKMMIVFNFMIMILLFIGFHIDYLDGQDTNTYYLINVDSSLENEFTYFINFNDETHEYVFSDQSGEYIIHKENNRYIIVSDSDEASELMKKDIQKVIKQKYKEAHPFMGYFIDEYENIAEEKIEQKEKKSNISYLVLLSVSYFLIMNFSMLISNEIIYEKGTHINKILLTNITAKQHLLSKIITGYLIPLLQFVLIVFIGITNMIIRYFEDGFEGLVNFMHLNVTENLDLYYELGISKIIIIGLVMMSSLMLIQIIMMFTVSKFTSDEQATSFSSIVYIGLLMIYFFALSIEINKNSIWIQILSYIPITSMVFMSNLIVENMVNPFVGLIPFVFSTFISIMMIKYGNHTYKRNILNN